MQMWAGTARGHNDVSTESPTGREKKKKTQAAPHSLHTPVFYGLLMLRRSPSSALAHPFLLQHARFAILHGFLGIFQCVKHRNFQLSIGTVQERSQNRPNTQPTPKPKSVADKELPIQISTKLLQIAQPAPEIWLIERSCSNGAGTSNSRSVDRFIVLQLFVDRYAQHCLK